MRRPFSVKSACTVPLTAICNRSNPFRAVPDCTGTVVYEKLETVSTKIQFSLKTVVRTYLFRFLPTHHSVPVPKENKKVNSFFFVPYRAVPYHTIDSTEKKENRNGKKKCIHSDLHSYTHSDPNSCIHSCIQTCRFFV